MPTPTPVQRLFSLLKEPSWCTALRPEFDKPYMAAIAQALDDAELAAAEGDAMVTPPKTDIFRALNTVPVDEVRAVIVGQDPYPSAGDADGLAFSVRRDTNLPSALGKILAEARRDLKWKGRKNGDLTPWAKSGVLLLNAALTNLVGYTWAHGDLDWQRFTKAVLEVVARRQRKAVILLWGTKAAKFQSVFEDTGHDVISSDHPCASRTFVEGSDKTPFKGSKPFTKTNNALRAAGLLEVDWLLPAAGKRPPRSSGERSTPARTMRRRRGR